MIGFILLRIRTGGGLFVPCEHLNKASGSIKGAKFLASWESRLSRWTLYITWFISFSSHCIVYVYLCIIYVLSDRLCGLVIRVPGYRSRVPAFDSRRYQIFCEVVSLERGPLRIVGITEELLEWKSSGFGSKKPRLTALGIRCADHATTSIRKSWH
jgi:hypothetical protein